MGSAVDVTDPLSTEQQREAKAVAVNRTRLVQDLRTECQAREREAAAVPQSPAAIKLAPARHALAPTQPTRKSSQRAAC